ncbi:MAG: tetratricopeptide repeat protein [Planctomycetota bacterium]|nr:tetratricopeptide repeat protein [Planctomycetota bacterium]
MNIPSLAERCALALAVFAFASFAAFAQEVKDEPDKEPKKEPKPTPKEITTLRMRLLPNMADIELQRAYQRAMRQHKMLPQLQKECRKFYEAAPSNPLGIYIHSRALDDPAKRKELLDKLVALDPKHPWPHVDFGEIALDAKDPVQAAKHFAKAEELAPESAGLFREIVGEYQRRNMSTQAIEWFEKAVKFDPAHVASLEALMDLCSDAEKSQRVVELAAKLTGIDPKHARYWCMYGYGLHRLNKHAEAREKYLKALEADPKYSWPAHNLGALAIGAGEYETAVDWFRKCLEWNPQYKSAWKKLLSVLYGKQKKYDETRDACMRALVYYPTDIWTYKVLAASLDQLKCENEATVYCEIIVILGREGAITDALDDLLEEGPTLKRGENVPEAVEKLPLEHLELLAKVMPAVCKDASKSPKFALRADALRDDVTRLMQKRKDEGEPE